MAQIIAFLNAAIKQLKDQILILKNMKLFLYFANNINIFVTHPTIIRLRKFR